MMEPFLVSANDAASFLGISRAYFYELLSNGRCPIQAIRFGKRRLWRVDLLKQWTLDNCPTSWKAENE